MKTLLFTAAIMAPVLGSANINSTETEFIDFKSINLSSYLEVKDKTIEIEKMEPKGEGQPLIHLVFQRDDKGNKVVLRHLFDLNRNGKVDLVKHFENKVMVKTEMDLDFDGLADVVTFYDKKTGELTRKIQSDGQSNIWKFWYKGELRRKEVDRNNDKKPDMWVHYRGGKVVKTEVDVNFDGKEIRLVK